MNVLTREQLADLEKQGWSVFRPGYDISYKSHWNNPWFFIREFFQNALDEHDQAGISTSPSIKLGPSGVVIEDQGRGLGAESLLLRESKAEGDLRGRFGEGLKFACIATVRMGYTPVIESSRVTIKAYASPMKMGAVEATLLVFLFKEEEERRGTRVTIEGYTGELYKDRFTTFLGKPILVEKSQRGRFTREQAVYAEPKGRLYVGDIYVKDLEKADYSYNLWGLELNPDRISEISNRGLKQAVAGLWSQLSTTTLALRALKSMTTEGTFESSLGWGANRAASKTVWRMAWGQEYGTRAVLHTSERLSKLAEAYGYKSTGMSWGYEVKNFLSYLVPTDEEIAEKRIKELSAPKIIPDSELGMSAKVNLKLVRFLTEACSACSYQGVKPRIVAAMIPEDPRTGDTIMGMCATSSGKIYLSQEVLEGEESALSTFYHEMGHWVGGEYAADGTMAHTSAVQSVAAAMSIIIQSKYGEIARLLGLTPPIAVIPTRPRVPPPPGVVLQPVYAQSAVDMDGQYTLDELKKMAREKGLSPSGGKKDIATKLIRAGLSPQSGVSKASLLRVASPRHPSTIETLRKYQLNRANKGGV